MRYALSILILIVGFLGCEASPSPAPQHRENDKYHQTYILYRNGKEVGRVRGVSVFTDTRWGQDNPCLWVRDIKNGRFTVEAMLCGSDVSVVATNDNRGLP